MLQPLVFILLACDTTTRRSFIGSVTSLIASVSHNLPTKANDDLYLAQPMGVPKNDKSDETVKPSAPLEYLFPAARVGIYIYQTLSLAEELSRLKSDGKDKGVTASLLDNMLLSKPAFLQDADPSVRRGDSYSLPPVVGEVAMAAQKQKERKERSVQVGLAPQLFEVSELIGERIQWNRLVKQEQAREGSSEIRKALNVYTTNLNFNPDKYVYSGTKEEKSKLVREDKLPTARDVIRSDLDSRDLYRNAVQTDLDDAKAEYIYQKKKNFEDLTDLVDLLRDAQRSIDKWFSFIPDEDIKEALEAVRKEQKEKFT